MATKKKTTAKKKPATKKVATKKTAAKKVATKKPAAAKKKASSVKARADFGAPIDGFFAKQPAELRRLLEVLREMVETAAPQAKASLKWGMPVYTLNGEMMCALGGHKSHVKLILAGPPGTFADPKGRLAGDGKTGRHLKLTKLEELPRDDVRRWLRAAVERLKA